jgi:hypothetical protein
MAKVTVQGLKGVKQLAHAVYDFAKDGGAFGAGNEINLFKLSADSIVHDFWLEVETAPLGGASTLEVGITGGDTDGIITQSAIANFPINLVSGDKFKGVALAELITLGVGDTQYINQKYKVTAETTLSLLIGTAALTAGKIHFYCEFSAGY